MSNITFSMTVKGVLAEKWHGCANCDRWVGMKNLNLTYLDEVDFGRLLICISYSIRELKTLKIVYVAICLRFGHF